MTTQVAIAGGNGFVGRHFAAYLAHIGVSHRILGRLDLEDINIDKALRDCDAVVNCAGEKSGVGPAAQFANVTLPQRLYAAANRAQAKQFVHVSSVAAIAGRSLPGKMITDTTAPTPETPYGRSKLEGDAMLGSMAGPTLTILRPPILIGADAKGVFALFRRGAMVGAPLPLAGADGLRNFMHVDNFSEAIMAAIRARLAGAYIVTDSPSLTSEAMYRQMLAASGRHARVFSIGSPGRALLRVLLGRRGESMFGYAEYDGSSFANEAKPHWPVPPEEIIAAAMSDFEHVPASGLSN
jgi:UDP-glucose 4-epimerase